MNAISDAIESSQFMLVVLSPDSVTSPWVQKEYTQALSLRRKIIPLMLEAASVPFALNTINFIDFSKGQYEENYKNLLSALGYTGETPAVTTFINARLKQIPALRRYAAPITAISILVIALIAYLLTRPGDVPPPPTTTPTQTAELPTATSSPSPGATFTVTSSLMATDEPTVTPTRPTITASPTLLYKITLPICISAESPNIYVRSSPDRRTRQKC